MINLYDFEKTMPEGFTMEQEGKTRFIIYYKRTGMIGMISFLIIFLAVWTKGCILLLQQDFGIEAARHGNSMPSWVVLIFLGAEVFLSFKVIYFLFCRKIFRLNYGKLIIETHVLTYNRTQIIQKNSLRRFVQIKDGGEDEDTFPSWGLQAETDERKITLIYRQPYEKSLWLGQILAKWANVKFISLQSPCKLL